jgi:hypothetical protein
LLFGETKTVDITMTENNDRDVKTRLSNKVNIIRKISKKNNIRCFYALGAEISKSNSSDCTKELINIGLENIPTIDNNEISRKEDSVSYFGERVLETKSISLNEKKKFISKVHIINPKFSKDVISLYNENCLRNILSSNEEIDHLELLSYFNKVAKLGNPNDKEFSHNLINTFPHSESHLNYSKSLAETMKKVPEHRINLARFGGDINKYKKYKKLELVKAATMRHRKEKTFVIQPPLANVR